MKNWKSMTGEVDPSLAEHAKDTKESGARGEAAGACTAEVAENTEERPRTNTLFTTRREPSVAPLRGRGSLPLRAGEGHGSGMEDRKRTSWRPWEHGALTPTQPPPSWRGRGYRAGHESVVPPPCLITEGGAIGRAMNRLSDLPASSRTGRGHRAGPDRSSDLPVSSRSGRGHRESHESVFRPPCLITEGEGPSGGP